MKTLAELKADNLPRAKTADILAVNGDPADVAEITMKVDAYLQAFLPPQEGGKCVRCGMVQGGLVAEIMGTGFRFGVVHGEGACGTCGYPARTFHRIEGLGTIEHFILQYHPNGLEEQPQAESA